MYLSKLVEVGNSVLTNGGIDPTLAVQTIHGLTQAKEFENIAGHAVIGLLFGAFLSIFVEPQRRYTTIGVGGLAGIFVSQT